MKDFLKVLLGQLLDHVLDVFYLGLSVLIMILYAKHRISFEAAALDLLLVLVFYQFVTNTKK